jgi:hypothetical protein
LRQACDVYAAKVHTCAEKDSRVAALGAVYRAQQDAWKQLPAESAKTQCDAALKSLPATMPNCP